MQNLKIFLVATRSTILRAALLAAFAPATCTLALPKPDLIVSADGFGDFQTIQAAIATIPATNRERIVVFVRKGVYHEKIRVDASFVTLYGENRRNTRIEFPQSNDDFTAKPDPLGRAVLNLNGANDFVLENFTIENTAGQVGPHAFTIYGTGDRTVITDCDVLSHGADTLSLWQGGSGRYYHARCAFQGSVDFVCPRGWCYLTDCSFYEMKNTAAVWHDGSKDPDMKFVMRDCKFDGVNGWVLGRHHRDAQFYFLNCDFSRTMADQPVRRVIYPLDNNPPDDASRKRNSELDKLNLWGERCYFYDCHRAGGNFDWLTNNLSLATNAPLPKQITAAWTFAGKWNPENKSGPTVRQVKVAGEKFLVTFSENVTVKGTPRLKLRRREYADYVSGTGTDTLVFNLSGHGPGEVTAIDLNDGAIIACEAATTLRVADLSLPGK